MLDLVDQTFYVSFLSTFSLNTVVGYCKAYSFQIPPEGEVQRKSVVVVLPGNAII